MQIYCDIFAQLLSGLSLLCSSHVMLEYNDLNWDSSLGFIS